MLTVPPGVVVDVDSVSIGHGVIRQRVHRDPGIPVKLLVTASGSLRHGNLVVRSARTGPRRSFWDWLLGRRPQARRRAAVSLSACIYSKWPDCGTFVPMDDLADRNDEDRDRALRRRRFLRVGGEVVLAFGAGGLLAGCNFSHGAGTGESSDHRARHRAAPTGSANPLSGSSGNSSS